MSQFLDKYRIYVISGIIWDTESLYAINEIDTNAIQSMHDVFYHTAVAEKTYYWEDFIDMLIDCGYNVVNLNKYISVIL